MASELRDRDAIISREGIIFRLYGYSHPPSGYICDVEYAPSSIYRSKDPRALRRGAENVFFKFFEDNGLKYVKRHYPRYRVYHHPLRRWLVGVKNRDVHSTRLPAQALQNILEGEYDDELVSVLREMLKELTMISSLKTRDFGVFGSLLHNFYHPKFSDIDLTIIGKRRLKELRKVLCSLYSEGGIFVNEFASKKTWSKRSWKFKNYSLKEYEKHQRSKVIYGVYMASKRRVKVEFEPVLAFDEIVSEYDRETRIKRLGWAEAIGRIVDDEQAGFIPSVYGVEVDETSNPQAKEVLRVLSYVEEFRLQAEKGERIFVAGNLEEVISSRNRFYQITLTHGPRYYEQTMKRIWANKVMDQKHS